MLKKTRSILFGLLGLFASSSFAENNFEMVIPSTLGDYELPSMTPLVVPNVFMWTLKATCIVLGNDIENPISVKMLRRKGTVNGTSISQGDFLEILVRSGDTFYITADPGATVEVLNKGEKTVRANCTTI